MKKETWAANLVIEADRLRNFLSFWFEEPIQIEIEGVGAKESAWIWGKLPIGQQEKWFKFAVYLLTGKAAVLFIQGGSYWPSKANDQFLCGMMAGKIGYEGERIFCGEIDIKEKDLFSRGFECWTWVNEDDFRNYKEAFVGGLMPKYKGLWMSVCQAEGEVV